MEPSHDEGSLARREMSQGFNMHKSRQYTNYTNSQCISSNTVKSWISGVPNPKLQCFSSRYVELSLANPLKQQGVKSRMKI